MKSFGLRRRSLQRRRSLIRHTAPFSALGAPHLSRLRDRASRKSLVVIAGVRRPSLACPGAPAAPSQEETAAMIANETVKGRASSAARDLRRQAKIRQILDAATEVFLEEGYAAASVDRIVEKSGVSKATIYSYYDSKENIFVDVMQLQFNSLFLNLDSNAYNSEDLEEILLSLGTDLLRIANSPVTLSLFRNIMAESQRFPALAHQFMHESSERVIRGIAEIIEKHVPDYSTRIGDTEEAGEYFLDNLTGTDYDRVLFGTTPPMNGQVIQARSHRAVKYFMATYGLGDAEPSPRSTRSNSSAPSR